MKNPFTYIPIKGYLKDLRENTGTRENTAGINNVKTYTIFIAATNPDRLRNTVRRGKKTRRNKNKDNKKK